jgi:hypothetical protein
MLGCCAWFYAVLVEKNRYPTPKQAKKSNVKANQNPIYRQSCGTAKTENTT